MKKALLFSVLILVFCSCTKEVKIDIPGYEEQVVIDGRIETGQPPIVLISKTKDIYSPTSLNAFLNGFQSGATVTVSDGTTTIVLTEICSDELPPGSEQQAAELFGIPAEELADYHLCAYTSFDPAIFGQVGKTYALTVVFEGKTYTSSTTIVPPVPLDNVFWKEDQDQPGSGFSWATLSDPGYEYNAYHWEVKRINKQADGQPRDKVFTKTYSPVFDDEFVNGQTFQFGYENPMDWDNPDVPDELKGYYQYGDSVVIKFSSIESAVYEFLEKKYLQLQSNGNPFSTPVNIPTNIQGGALGVWAAYSPFFDTLYCVP